MAADDALIEVPLRVRCAELTEIVQGDLKRLKHERQDLQHEKEQYGAMRKSVAEVHFEDPIVLDIGGQRFKTSLDTLRRDRGSMLAAMFSGTGFKMCPDKDGNYFIDRDGAHFRHILNYLRGCFSVEGLSKATINELAAEADFYQLKDMYIVLRPPIVMLLPDTVGNGLFYYLGMRSRSQWSNPADSGKIQVSGTFESLEQMIARSPDTGCGSCSPARGKYIEIRLLSGQFRPMHYSLAWNGDCCKGATWTFFGDKAGDVSETWTEIHRSAGGGQSPTTTAPVLFGVPSPASFYKAFKFECTGCDQSLSCYCFHVGQLEVYGELDEQEQKAD